MILRGECLACAKLGSCRETNVERILRSYTCVMFEAVAEPVYQARWTAMKQYGEENTAKAMLKLNDPPEVEGEDDV